MSIRNRSMIRYRRERLGRGEVSGCNSVIIVIIIYHLKKNSHKGNFFVDRRK